MAKSEYKIRSKIWLYPGMAGWHFLSVPKRQTAEIKKAYVGKTKGWGSLPVEATIGKTSWKSSIFPESKSGTYLLPLKAAVRKKEDIFADDMVTFSIKILV
jgi:hypothetical protein